MAFPTRTGREGAVERDYDEFHDYTAFRIGFDLGNSGYRMSLTTVVRGNVPLPKAPPERVNISIYKPDTWGAEELVFLVGVNRIEPSTDQRVWEWAYFDLRTIDLLEMVKTRDVRGRVHYREFSLSAKDYEALYDFASILKP